MHHDVIIIGSGAGGSAAAYHLTQTGKRVLLLEKGPALPRDGSTLDVEQVVRRGAFTSHEPWIDRDGRDTIPQERFNVGGKSERQRRDLPARVDAADPVDHPLQIRFDRELPYAQ